MNTIALYRILYGEDFLRKSVKSILPATDRVFIFLARRPWGTSNAVVYDGMTWVWPEKFDRAPDIATELQEEYGRDKVTVIWEQSKTPKEQYSKLLYHKVWPYLDKTPDVVVYMEPDQVFAPKQFKKVVEGFALSPAPIAACRQIELWKTFEWRIPHRSRFGAFMYKINKLGFIPQTGFSGAPAHEAIANIDSPLHNFGFCFNKNTMLWKHLTAMAFSKEIGDSLPAENWYRDKWLNWTPDTRNLEISEKHAHFIHKAEPYSMPKPMLEYMKS